MPVELLTNVCYTVIGKIWGIFAQRCG